MAPKKKKNKNSHNEFYYFMQDQRRLLRSENIYYESMDHLVSLCQPRWNALPDSEKAKYKQIAKQAKAQALESLDTKLDSRGRTLTSVISEKESLEQRLSQKMKKVKSIISDAKEFGNLTTTPFFLVHINNLCKVNEEYFVPCELAIVKFSLRDGILDSFHTFIKPPEEVIPLGYGFEIQKNADETHGLTMDEDPLLHSKSSMYGEIAEKILKRINPNGMNGVMLPIFTLESDELAVEAVLRDLMSWAGIPVAQDFQVYFIHHLLHVISQTLPREYVIKSDLLAADVIASDTSSYALGMACPYHDFINRSRFCSLNCVKRWAFLILEKCCGPLNIEQMPDSHTHVERALHEDRQTKYPEDFHVDTVIAESENGQDLDTFSSDDMMFGAAKSRAAPAGFVFVNPEESIKNPKKMNAREREEFERMLAAKGQTLEDWTGMKKSLAADVSEPALLPEPPCPW